LADGISCFFGPPNAFKERLSQMEKPHFSLENWQRQRLNEYIFLRCGEQSAFDQISKDVKTDAELLIAALGLGSF
jgi:hypothetical protein